MKSDSLLRCNFTDLFDGLNCSNLVIREHQRDQYSLWTNRAADIFRIYETVAIDGQNGKFYSTLRQGPARVKHRNVLNRRRNHMLDFAGRRGHSAENRVVIRFRASTGKHDIRGACSHKSRHGRPTLLDCSARILAERVDRAGVAEFLSEVRQHGRQNFGRHWSRPVVVEVNPLHVWALNAEYRSRVERPRRLGGEPALIGKFLPSHESFGGRDFSPDEKRPLSRGFNT